MFFGTLALVICLGGCQKLEFIPSEPNAILPLEKGSYWIFEEDFTAQFNWASDTIHLECASEITWEVLEKGYLDISDTKDTRKEVFNMRSTRNNESVYYHLRPEANGIVIYNITRDSPSEIGRSPVESCYGMGSYKQHLIKYPFPSSIDLQQNVVVGCGENDCFDELVRSVQYNGPRTLAPEGMTSIIVGNESIDATKLGNEYWAPGVGLVRIERDYYATWQNDTTFYHLTWQLKEYGVR